MRIIASAQGRRRAKAKSRGWAYCADVGQCGGVRQHMGRIAAVARDAGCSLDVLAGESIAAPAVAATTAGAAEPADPDSRARFPAADFRAQAVDRADHLMAEGPSDCHLQRCVGGPRRPTSQGRKPMTVSCGGLSSDP
jgi:hypothetical protein